MAELQPALGESGLGEYRGTTRARGPVLGFESVEYALHVISLANLTYKIYKFTQEDYHLI